MRWLGAAVVLVLSTMGTAAGHGAQVLRPGSVIQNEANGSCTSAFLFDGDDGRAYLATAGHCVGRVGEQVRFDPGLSGGSVAVGPVVHRSYAGCDAEVAPGVCGTTVGGIDFALVRIEPDVALDPTPWGMPAPTDVAPCGRLSVGQPVQFVGHPLGVEGTLHLPAVWPEMGLGELDVQPTNMPPFQGTGIVGGHYGERFWMASAAAPGHSGSPVQTPDGFAVGILVAVGAGRDSDEGTAHAGVVATCLDSALAEAESALGLSLTLM